MRKGEYAKRNNKPGQQNPFIGFYVFRRNNFFEEGEKKDHRERQESPKESVEKEEVAGVIFPNVLPGDSPETLFPEVKAKTVESILLIQSITHGEEQHRQKKQADKSFPTKEMAKRFS